MSLSHQYVQDHLLSMHRLPPSEQVALEEHLVACPECRVFAAFHQTLRQTLPFPAGTSRPSERDIREKIQIVRARVEKHRWQTRIMYHTLSFTGAVAILVLIFISILSVPRLVPLLTQASKTPAHQAKSMDWLTFHDPQNRFTLQYPANWIVGGQVSRTSVLQLTAPAVPNQPSVKIEIGIYNHNIDERDDFEQWLDAYNRQASDFTPDQLQTHKREAIQIDGFTALHIVQTSPMGDYQYTAIRRPAEVWFIWSNIGWSAKPDYETIYQSVLRNLKFTPVSRGSSTDSRTSKKPTAMTSSSTPIPSTETTMPFLSSFPLYPGTTWVWKKTGYTQAKGDPQKIIQGTAKIEERVTDIQTISSYQLVHIHGNKKMISSDPGWQENGTFGLGDYEYWYVIKDNQVYLSYGTPDPAQMQFDQMRLLYQFPLQVGSEWCPGSEIKGKPVPDMQSCGNKTVVTNKGHFVSPLGDFTTCYEIHDTSNSGDVISQFCKGIGLVAQKYDHAGSRFGDDQQLVQFTNGKDGSTLTTKTSAATPTTEMNGDIERIPSPDDRWTVLYRRRIGQLTIEDGQGKQTPVAVDGQDKYLVPGSWSPDSRYLLLWQGIDSASIQADGLPLWSIDVSTGNTFRISKSVLVNPGYSSWAPDGHALVFTNGGYRSAQVGKWLSLYTPADQKVTDLVPQEKLVPGLVAWSPDGKTIAFAAVDANHTRQEYADFSDWENPAILARRIYRLDPQIGTYQRLNTQEDFQDAPRWDLTGRLYFVQLAQALARVMWVSDLAAGVAYAVPGCQGARMTPAGYYGQIDWSFLFDACPATKGKGVITPTPLNPNPQ